MKITLTEETIDYVGELYIKNKDIIGTTFEDFLELWIRHKELGLRYSRGDDIFVKN